MTEQQYARWMRLSVGLARSGFQGITRRRRRKLVVERFHRQLMFLYGDEASAKAWMQAPHPELYGRSPRQLLDAGWLEPVYALLDRLRDGVYA